MIKNNSHIAYSIVYLVIAVITFFINMQIATFIFGVLCLNSVRLVFVDKK